MKKLRYLEGVSTFQLDTEKCSGCGMCPQVCPHGLLEMHEGKAGIVDIDRCMECGACAKNCPVEAISVEAGVGCASAIIYGWLTGNEPSCDCSGGSSCC
ncbi:MAG: 4Fe-4S dicluster domain-containing protein [Desulfuromonadales bacterium]|nr:4Fe-4S dicluster domain-containing protein [Desulfuromonadales bacterium]NIR33813.1 4Fe-4S dicluster domain-containing protein [Desulfuromonadales bacterium]NIS41402.1 4Fe-4S dicluster domain-containing protein [Desulfuromonadales bacterium]